MVCAPFHPSAKISHKMALSLGQQRVMGGAQLATKPARYTRAVFRRSTLAPRAAATGANRNATASGWAVEGNRPTSPRAWEIMSTALKKNKITLISPQEVAFAAQRGDPIVDIRPAKDYAAERIPGAVGAEFLRMIEGWDPIKIVRRAVYAFFGVLNGTELNDRFVEEFQAAVPDTNKQVILYCNIGGTLEKTGPSEFGQQSRSLSAAYYLLTEAGYKRIRILDGGFAAWKRSGREVEKTIGM